MGKIKHRMSNTPTHRSWINMRRRIFDSGHHNYPQYGGRGITICERWSDFANFYADMGDRPSGHTLDRIDTNGPYSPENCRWAVPIVQQNNRRVTTMLTREGVTKSLREWCSITGIPRAILASRKKTGWSDKEVIETPYKPHSAEPKKKPKRIFRLISLGGRTQTATAWAKELGLKKVTVMGRLRRGWDPILAITTPVE